MNFKAYDLLSSLVPGFLALLAGFAIFDIKFDKDLIVAYTAIAFLLGYLINTLSSWLEDFYFLTWGGKPSIRLINGKDIWKVRFYHADRAKRLLTADNDNQAANIDALFSIAMRKANGEKDTRIDDFDSFYAFSRAILTTVLFSAIGLLIEHYDSAEYYLVLLPLVFIVWLRCKQRAYYYSREVLNVYLKSKNA